MHATPVRRTIGSCFVLAMVLVTSQAANAQFRMPVYAFSHGGGVTGDQSVRFAVTVGLATAGLGTSPESAGGAGFWYATREGLVIVANESEGPPEGIPQDFELHSNYPNPFNPSTKIRYGVPETAFVKIAVYNILGQSVAELVAKEQTAGYYDVEWNGRDASGGLAPSGVYFYRIEAGGFAATRTMVLQK